MSADSEVGKGDAGAGAARDLLITLKEMRGVIDACVRDTVGTPSFPFFSVKLKHCDVAIARAEGVLAALSNTSTSPTGSVKPEGQR